MCLNSELRDGLTILELLSVLNKRLEVELEVELEARDHGWHIIKLIELVLEVAIDVRLPNVLPLEVVDQFRD